MTQTTDTILTTSTAAQATSTTCRICGREDLASVLDLGDQPRRYAFAFPDDSARIELAPLALSRCRSCSLVQRQRGVSGREAAPPPPLEGRSHSLKHSFVLDRLEDPCAFAKEVRQHLTEDGIWTVDVSYLPSMLRATAFDAVEHGRCSYFRIATFERILEGSGLELVDAALPTGDDGSIRLMAAPRGTRTASDRLQQARARESRLMLDTDAPYKGFAHQLKRSRAAVQRFFGYTLRAKRSVWAYGTKAHCAVALRHYGLDNASIQAIADLSDDAIGSTTSGSSPIPVRSMQDLRDTQPDYLLVLPWQDIDEILAEMRQYLDAGGKLVVATPDFRIYTATARKSGRAAARQSI